MKICKYCKKPISDNDVWNPDSEGNGYHHVCLCEMEFRSRDRQIYDKGRADVLDKIRAEIQDIAFDSQEIDGEHESIMILELNDALNIIDKHKAESEENGNVN